MVSTESKIEKFRDRKFCLLLYPEDDSHVRALDIIKKTYDYAFILHNKDVNENSGEVKKEHWHVVIRTGENAIWNTALAKELNITDNYIQRCRNLDRALLYLLHYNDKEKAQYPIDEVKGLLKKRLKIAISKDDKTEQEKAEILIDFILSQTIQIRFTDVIKKACNLGYYDTVRRSPMIFKKLVDEQNEQLKIISVYSEPNSESWCTVD